MHIGNFAPLIFFALIFGWFAYRIVKYGGLKASLYGAKIRRTVGEFKLQDRGSIKTTVRVQLLEAGPGEPKVGLEVSQKTIGAFSIRFFKFSGEEAGELARFLQEAANGPEI